MYKKTSLSAAVLAASFCLPVQAQTVQSPTDPLASELETLVVVASRAETPRRQLGASVAVMDQADIKALGMPSLANVLRTIPSVSVVNTGGMGKASSLRVRGEEGFRTLVRVDGVDISDPTGTRASSQIQHLLSANVGRVELLRGPQGMMYGADAGGVLDIYTDRVRDGFEGGARYEAGRYNTQTYSGHLGGAGDQGDFYLSGARATTDGFNAHMADESGEPDGYENTTFHARVGWNLSDSFRAQAVVRDTEAESEFDRCGFPAIDDCIGYFDQRNARVSLSHTHSAGENTLAYSKTDVSRTNYAGGEVSYDTEGEIAKWELNGRLALNPIHAFAYGLEHRSDQVLELERGQEGAYLEYQGEYAERLYLTAGVRRDDNDDFGGHTSYRVSAAYLIPNIGPGTLKLKSSLGSGFRAPSLYEIDFNRQQNNPDLGPLAPEESLGLDLGVEYFGPGNLRLEAVVFEQRVDDEIYFDMVGFTGYLQSERDSRSRGVELVGELPVLDNLWLNANYTYVDAESDDGAPRSRQPKHLGNIGVRYTPVDALSLSLNWRTSRDRQEGDTPLDNYQVVDASARYQVLEGMVVYLRGENILDEDYVEVPSYNTAGAAAYAGVELTF